MPEEATFRLGSPPRGEGRALCPVPLGQSEGTFTDPATDLVYYGQRYYSPSLGRFINRDPIEEQGGLNLYAFVRNNAVNAWDCLGMDPLSEWMGDNLSPPDVPTIAPPSGGYPVDPTTWAIGWNGHDDMEYDPRTAMWVPSGSIMRDNIDYMSQANQAIGDVLRLQARAELSGNIQVLGRTAAGDLVVAAFSSDAAALLASIGTTTAITAGMSLADVGALVGLPSAPNSAGSAGTASGWSGLGNALRHIPILGGILGGVGDVVSGIGNTALGVVSLGQSGTLGRGVGQIASGTLSTVGNVWAMPNTAVGLVYGAVGLPFGAKPVWDSNDAILRFTNMPGWLMPSAMSLGHVQVYGLGTYRNADGSPALNRFGVPVVREETLHTRQAEVLGPLYLPLHILSMGGSLLTGGGTHDNNPLERGPERGVTPWPWK